MWWKALSLSLEPSISCNGSRDMACKISQMWHIGNYYTTWVSEERRNRILSSCHVDCDDASAAGAATWPTDELRRNSISPDRHSGSMGLSPSLVIIVDDSCTFTLSAAAATTSHNLPVYAIPTPHATPFVTSSCQPQQQQLSAQSPHCRTSQRLVIPPSPAAGATTAVPTTIKLRERRTVLAAACVP